MPVFHYVRNGMDHSIPIVLESMNSSPAGMDWPLQSDRIESFTLAGLTCHSTPSRKKYAAWSLPTKTALDMSCEKKELIDEAGIKAFKKVFQAIYEKK